MSELLTTGKLKCLAVKPETHHRFSVVAAITGKTQDQLLVDLMDLAVSESNDQQMTRLMENMKPEVSP